MRDNKKKIIKEILEWVYCIVIAVILALFVRYYIGTPTIVQQPSMYPTLQSDERLILNRLAMTFNMDINRGDIVTFESPTVNYITISDVDRNNPVAIYDYEPEGIINKFMYYVLEINKISYIKRVIALEGEHIKITNGEVYINGEILEEEYLQEDVVTDSLEGLYIDLTVPEDCVFVMGDNRAQSTDSRRFGCIPIEKIESKVLIRFWPFNKFGTV